MNGVDPVTFAYDADRRLVQAGALGLARDPGNGLLTGLTLGDVATAITWNAFGETACSRSPTQLPTGLPVQVPVRIPIRFPTPVFVP